MIAREDKGPIGGIDYNRSPTVYFETDKVAASDINIPNTTKPTKSYNGKSINSIFEYAEKFCKIIQTSKATKHLSDQIKSIGEVPFSSSFSNSEGSKLIYSILSGLSNRLDSVEHFLSSIVCSSR